MVFCSWCEGATFTGGCGLSVLQRALKTLLGEEGSDHMAPNRSGQESQIQEMSTQRAERLAFCHLFPNIIFGSRASMWSVLLTADPLTLRSAGNDSPAL